ncbi:unnamed protein product, partial [Tetraodon nigroviridis]
KEGDIYILDNGRTAKDFMDKKIKEFDSMGGEGPFFVVDLDTLVQKHLKWLSNLPRVKPFYAVKCNSTPTVLKTLSALGTGFDCASKNLLGFQLSVLDIGGGLPGKDIPVTFQECSDVINEALDEYFPLDGGVQIIAEPGRYYVESIFTLAANVIAKRAVMDDVTKDEGRESTERLMMYYLNEGVYGSLNWLLTDPDYIEIKPYLHGAEESREQRYRSVIWGPTCDCVDKIIDNYMIPDLRVGDWFLIEKIGAYSISSRTDYNGFEKAHIYFAVTNETWRTLS